jgi:uncharacterized membrane protein
VLCALAFGLVFLVLWLWIGILGAILGPRSPAGRLVLGLGMLAFVATAIYLGIRFSQSQFMIIDRRVGPIDGLRLSWEATRHRVSTMLLVYALAVLINLAGFLACIVGLIFTIPFTSLLLAVTYLSLTGQPLGLGKARAEAWDQEWDERI